MVRVILQDKCWKSKVKITQFVDFEPRKKLLNKDINFWADIDNPQYDELFEGSAIRRAKFEKFKMNALIVKNNLK